MTFEERRNSERLEEMDKLFALLRNLQHNKEVASACFELWRSEIIELQKTKLLLQKSLGLL